MARSAHAYVRGNTAKFYEWLDSSHGRAVPQGPPVWICGDCHSGNLGPVANFDGHIEVQIRDLDQTVIGNPAHDLIRLGLSLATSVRGSDLPGVTTARMLEAMVKGYASALSRNRDRGDIPKPVHLVMSSAMRRRWRHLARERIENTRPTIPLGRRFWPVTKSESAAIHGLFETVEAHTLVRQMRGRADDARVAVEDCAYWMKGCSSLGGLRYAAIVSVSDPSGVNDQFCLMDIKEAVQAVAPRYETAEMPRDNARRVVAGAVHLSPHLGQRMLATRLLDRSVFVRELLPQDLKLELDTMSQYETIDVARYLAATVGRAHRRQLADKDLQDWHKVMRKSTSKTLDAPSWLWSSIVELIVSHEAGYLDHCRRYASQCSA